MADLSGKVALVTGSTKGIGLEVARAFVAAGADVVVSSRTSDEVRETAARLSEEARGRVEGIACDVRDPDACAALVEGAVERLGRLDVLVNNAGLGVLASILEMSVDDWRRQIETNLGGVFYCSRAAAPHLARSGDGWIVNIGSLAGRNPFAGGTGYNASKFGLLGMSEAMMLDLRYEGVRVSLIMPGSVNTSFNGREPREEGDWRLQPEDVARAVLALLDYPAGALVSRMEMRPTCPPRG